MSLNLGISLFSLASRVALAGPHYEPWRDTVTALARQIEARGGQPPAMAASPTVSISATSVLAGPLIDKGDARIKAYGGILRNPAGDVYPSNQFSQIDNLTYESGDRTARQVQRKFGCSSPRFEILVSSGELLRIIVDGEESANYLSAGILPGDTTPRWLLVDFSAIDPGIKRREIRIEGQSTRIGGIKLDTIGQLYAPRDDAGLRAIALTDSFGEAGADFAWTTLFAKSFKDLGFEDYGVSAFGGTGINTGIAFGGQYRPALIDRIVDDGVNANADVYVLAEALNDSAGVGPSMVSILNQLRAARPAAVILVVKAWCPTAPTPTPTKVIVNAEIEAAAAGRGGVFLFDPTTVSYEKVGGGDETHPSQNGHNTLQAWLTSVVTTAMGEAEAGLYPPVNTVAPSIQGTFLEDDILYADVGTWRNEPTAFSYQWLRDGVDISGATQEYYTVGPSDPGTALSVRVTATNADGSAVLTSAGITSLYGPNLISNGTFDAATGWTLETGWSISGGKLVGTAVGSPNAAINVSAPAGKVYRMQCDVVRTSGSGTFNVQVGGVGVTFGGVTLSSTGQKVSTVDLTLTGPATQFRVLGNSAQPFTGEIDNLSLREVL